MVTLLLYTIVAYNLPSWIRSGPRCKGVKGDNRNIYVLFASASDLAQDTKSFNPVKNSTHRLKDRFVSINWVPSISLFMELSILSIALYFALFVAALACVDLTSFTKKLFLSPENLRTLRGISFYHSGYFITSAIISWFFVSFIFGNLQEFNFLGTMKDYCTTFSKFLSKLENNEVTYQCQFGLSINAIRCEIYGNINRLLLMVSYQCLKYVQESLSFTNFNVFRVLSFFTFLNTFVRRIFAAVKPYELFNLIVNNALVLSISIVNTVYSIYNWRQIVQEMVMDDEVEVVEKKVVYEKGYRGIPCLAISRTQWGALSARISQFYFFTSRCRGLYIYHFTMT